LYSASSRSVQKIGGYCQLRFGMLTRCYVLTKFSGHGKIAVESMQGAGFSSNCRTGVNDYDE